MIFKKFTVNDKEYEIRVEYTGQELVVRAYHNNKPANGYSYHITIETARNLSDLANLDAINELVAIAESDVTEKRYEKLISAIR